jgi:hypothetical protein
MNFDVREIVIVEAGPPQALVIQAKSQRLDQMQSGAGVRAQANDVAGITRNLRLEQHDMNHELDYELVFVLAIPAAATLASALALALALALAFAFAASARLFAMLFIGGDSRLLENHSLRRIIEIDARAAELVDDAEIHGLLQIEQGIEAGLLREVGQLEVQG